MSARDRVHAMLPPLYIPAEAEARAAELDARLDAVRVEDLNEALAVLRGWQGEISELRAPGLEFAIGVLLAVRDDHDPAGKAAPRFFQVGRTYRHRGNEFRVLAVDPHPVRGDLTAIGWLIEPDGTCLIFRMTALDWQSGKWADATEEVAR